VLFGAVVHAPQTIMAESVGLEVVRGGGDRWLPHIGSFHHFGALAIPGFASTIQR
jgi:hypothetical protein